MNAKTTIRKIAFIAVWLCIGGGMLTLLLAAISKKNKGQCKDYSITIKGAQNNFFIDQKDVEQLLMKAANGKIKGQAVSSFRLHELESMLEKNTWISEAEMYFDNQDVLHITITEKEPVARLFTVAGNTFYIDSAARKMPLSDKLSARVPVFTGFPEKKVLTAKDSVLLDNVRMAANYIISHPFWMSQVAQVDITPQGTFEMIPVVGNHIVRLGNGENMDKKLNRLMVFYKQVLSKAGFDAYKVIDVQYAGQVVVSKYAGDAKVDSVLLRKNVEKLLQQSREAENDTVARALPAVVNNLANDDTDVTTGKENNPNNSVTLEHDNPNPLKSNLPAKPADKPNGKPADNKPVKVNKPATPVKKKEPKALMPKRPTEGVSEYN
jgi:cell division protein FtsQ